MSQTFGMETPSAHSLSELRQPARYLVVIDSGGSMVARLFLDSREPVAEFDASVEEVTHMIDGLVPVTGATGTEWDVALQGHNHGERAEAKVYTLSV